MADAGQGNTAYDVSNAAVRTHAVCTPTTCIMRYPGRPSMIVLNIIPVGLDARWRPTAPGQTLDEAEVEAIRYLAGCCRSRTLGWLKASSAA